MHKLLFAAALLFAPSLALADEAPAVEKHPPISEPAGGGHGAGHETAHGAHHDPSKHFRFFGSPVDHYGKDATGGVYGDNIQLDPATGQPMVDSHGQALEEPMSAPFIFMVLNFALLLVLLSWKGKPAFQKLAVDRHEQIKTALDEAAKLRRDAQEKLAEYDSKLKAANDEITKLVEGMRADAEADKKRILENAERQAAQMKKDAEQRIAAELESARAMLRREVALAATGAAEKVLREKMTAADQTKVITTFITDVQQSAKEAR